jgi:hypothetical protein
MRAKQRRCATRRTTGGSEMPRGGKLTRLLVERHCSFDGISHRDRRQRFRPAADGPDYEAVFARLTVTLWFPAKAGSPARTLVFTFIDHAFIRFADLTVTL